MYPPSLQLGHLPPADRVRAHSIRAQATSAISLQQVLMLNICKVLTWSRGVQVHFHETLYFSPSLFCRHSFWDGSVTNIYTTFILTPSSCLTAAYWSPMCGITHRDKHLRKKQVIYTCKWKFFKMCGHYQYSTSCPPFSLLRIMTGFTVEKELERHLVHASPFTYGAEHELIRSADMDQLTLPAGFSGLRCMLLMFSQVWNRDRDQYILKNLGYR